MNFPHPPMRGRTRVAVGFWCYFVHSNPSLIVDTQKNFKKTFLRTHVDMNKKYKSYGVSDASKRNILSSVLLGNFFTCFPHVSY